MTILAIAIFVFVAIALVNFFAPRLVKVATRRRLAGKPDEEIQQATETLTHVFTRTGGTLLLVLGFFTSLPEMGINIGPLIAGVGVVGIAVGFGAQSLVKDIIAGMFILLDNQYGKGDVVRIAGTTGLVEDVGLRRTVMRDLDGIVHYVPNGQITVTSNFTQEFSRVNLNVRVAYTEDLDRAMAVINRVGEELAADPEWKDLIITAPKCLRVDAFGDSGIDIKIVGDVQPIRQWEVMGELRRRLKRRFDEEGIEIPFPGRVMVYDPKASAPVKLPPIDTEPSKDPLQRLPDSGGGSGGPPG
ncbi:MAG: mechanosensitive ion channel family protein [Dehalococcoidia bacterium]